MLHRTAVLCLSLLAVLLLGLSPAHAGGPRFSWSAFQRFWDKAASPLVHLHNAEKVEDGYLIDFGYTTTLRVLMEDDVVRGVSVRFVGGKGHDAGGPRFLRLVHQAITTGTYQWPPEKIREVREYFSVMTPEPKEYRYRTSIFQRTYTKGKGWEFLFTFVR